MRYVKIKSPSRKKVFKKYKLLLWITGLIVFLSLIFAFFNGPGEVFQYIFQGGLGVRNEDGKVNVLLLGNPGGTHDGPYLTDTVMMASVNLKGNEIDLISLPRDFWLDKYRLKLNAVYAVGQDRGGGLKFAKVVLEEVLGIPVHYGIRMDFRGFVKAIDQVGGLDLTINRSFTDYLYPIAGKENDLCGLVEEEKELSEEEGKQYNLKPGKQKVILKPDGKVATESADFPCRFETIAFQQGETKLDGESALKFVRSRMGNNNEGSDFARSKRQQKVLEAFRRKALSLETLASPGQIQKLLSTFGESIETDLSVDDAIILYGFIKKANQVKSYVVDGQKQGSLLINPPLPDFGGAWVLVPKAGNYSEIHDFVKKILEGRVDESSPTARTGN